MRQLKINFEDLGTFTKKNLTATVILKIIDSTADELYFKFFLYYF